MLFNSYAFLLGFLPATLALFHVLGKRYGQGAATFVLIFASLFFYGYWNPVYLPLIAGSLVSNFVLGRALTRLKASRARERRALLCFGVAGNLGALAYYKYAGFFARSVEQALGIELAIEQVVLPLAISFFTFQQIGYLVDAHREQASTHTFRDYAFFILFFPQLIAGPIVRHHELMPQLAQRSLRLRAEDFAVGTTLVVFGLFKKVVIADHLAGVVSPTYAALAAGEVLDAPLAWLTVFAYALQLYFDFSGYSDMAVGLARMFGLVFPHNFASPYKATSIVDFWRRWHVTLSRFLRDYLYIPLGGGHGGFLARARNLMITMLLGGLWHGAGWGFVLWGAIHGALLLGNHALFAWRDRSHSRFLHSPLAARAGSVLTFVLVSLAWIPFRSPDLSIANRLWSALWKPTSFAQLRLFSADYAGHTLLVLGALVIVRLAPNSQEVLASFRPVLDANLTPARIGWRPSGGWAVTVAALATASLLCLTQVSEFLYFQF